MDVATAYVSKEFDALLNNAQRGASGEEPQWFSSLSRCSLAENGDVTFFDRPAEYLAATSKALGNARVSVSQVQASEGAQASIFAVATGVLVDETGTRDFTLAVTLWQADSHDAFYVVSEVFTIGTVVPHPPAPQAAAAVEEKEPTPRQQPAAEPAAAPVEAERAPTPPQEPSGPPTPPSPPSSPAAAPTQAPAAVTTMEEVKPPKAAAPAQKPAAKASSPAPEAAPAAKGWAAILKQKDAPMQPVAKPAPKPPSPQPQAAATTAAAPAAPAAPVRPKKPVAESTAVFRVNGPVSDEDLKNALPAALRSKVIEIRNKSAEPTIGRVWIEFSVPNAVTAINDAKVAVNGEEIRAELPRKKN